METLSLLKALLLIVGPAILLAGIIYLLGWWIVRYGKLQFQREDEYDKLYKKILVDIETKKVSGHNYDIIFYDLEKLGQLKWKNREKTHVLTMSFFRKYAAEAKGTFLKANGIHRYMDATEG